MAVPKQRVECAPAGSAVARSARCPGCGHDPHGGICDVLVTDLRYAGFDDPYQDCGCTYVRNTDE